MDSTNDAPTGVGRTALAVAAMRASESARPDRLFDDPYARAFLAAAPDMVEEYRAAANNPTELVTALIEHGTVRTRFFDEYLLKACAGGCRQVVLLAAGLDTRAFRLPWPDGVRLFEVDTPEVLSFKHRVLDGAGASPTCQRFAVQADLRENWSAALTGQGFDPSVPTAWLAEGLLIYLTAEETAALLGTVGELSTLDSRLAMEHQDDAGISMLDRAHTDPAMAGYAALWRGGLGERLPSWLAEHGWATTWHRATDLDYGRAFEGIPGEGFVEANRLPRSGV
ncbi:methyltransferase (TIGR00027 family) [Herbihabitans rhizosphaerae]|uniref:S-adenosyl-L-methionine-dependent methyltransferase n=1 Tax=Herbihabitans rhizosphaerae TaxID=1872711 RepID=A0A4Q7KLX5_9PSEU|nr:SAM-dependent methyltransferase [Herbihabitans rhizosphaerae]RZS37668.1 methyltransferase (TIGR00027 family) [Herbihabitans rhizosphaerae]